MSTKIVRFLIGLGVLSLMIYALVNHKGSTYSSDGSINGAIEDQIETDRIKEYKYKNSLEGKYEKGEKDTTITDNGDMVIFYITTDTIKKDK